MSFGVQHRVIHLVMPTTRARILVTESDALAAALDTAATYWPTLSRSQLLIKLALAAAGPLGAEERRGRRLEAARQLSGSLDYPPNYLTELRQDWPA